MNSEPQSYSVKEVVKILKMNVVLVCRLIKSGQLKAHRFTERRTRVHRDDLRNFIETVKTR